MDRIISRVIKLCGVKYSNIENWLLGASFLVKLLVCSVLVGDVPNSYGSE
jgi:hypothetical protein